MTRAQFGIDRINPLRRPSIPFGGHSPSLSTSSFTVATNGGGYAPSIYAASTLAASTIMPQSMMQTVKDSETTKWVEGHCMVKRAKPDSLPCTICNEKCSDEAFCCTGKLSFSRETRRSDLGRTLSSLSSTDDFDFQGVRFKPMPAASPRSHLCVPAHSDQISSAPPLSGVLLHSSTLTVGICTMQAAIDVKLDCYITSMATHS